MNLFNKNPFSTKSINTKIVGNNIQFDEKQKLENIRINMNKLKFNKPNETNTELNIKDRIDNLKSMDKWK